MKYQIGSGGILHSPLLTQSATFLSHAIMDGVVPDKESKRCAKTKVQPA
jgi:hypothetical protein